MIKNNYPPPSVFFSQQMKRITSFAEHRFLPCVFSPTIFEVSCSNVISCILSRSSGACWKLLMTDVSPHCHTPCIIWFGKQHTVFCSISMSQTVCKQLVITQFSENHYFPMRSWTASKLGFWHGPGGTRDALQPCISQVFMKEWRRGFLWARCLLWR